MSGSGRKSQYRKSVTSNFLNENVVPTEHQSIVLVTGNRGSNLFEIQMSNGNVEMARLPNKFNKLIWIKKNDYLIVTNTEHESASTSADVVVCKVKYEINNVINKDNIKLLTVSGLWPKEFVKESSGECVDKDDLMPGYDENDNSWEDDENDC